uniref:Uncharacterized protein n=1 Tax=Cairina moschata TaxID=8855 RepID=A0A8C3D4C6_CAIMO
MLQSPPGASPASAPAMDKSSPCGSGAPGSSAGGKGQQPRSASAGPAAGESKPKGGELIRSRKFVAPLHSFQNLKMGQ